MEKLDLAKADKAYYRADTTPQFIRLAALHYVSIQGKGDPSGTSFKEVIQTLYPVVYTLKFRMKAKGRDFVVPKLEALWWYDETRFGKPGIAESPLAIPREEWEYRLLIRLPEDVIERDLAEALHAVQQKKSLPLLAGIEFFRMEEGLCVQVLHKGPFHKEPETLLKLQAFMQEKNLAQNGYHHEIYLSDFNKTDPEKLRTILREPVKPR